MLWVISLHALLGAAILVWGRHLRRRAFWVAALGPAAVLGWITNAYSRVRLQGPVAEDLTWVPALDISLTLRIDGFSLVMLALIGAAGVAIFGFAAQYMRDEPRTARFAGLMVLFGGAMAGIVTADNLFGLFVFWEITTVTSYLLIGHDDQRPTARSAALQAALTTGVGGLAMLAGFVLLAGAAGSWSISEIVAAPPTGVDLAMALILIGALTKSAQAPFHFWLPGAMAAPTPASAFLHSATMVKAGVYLIARFSPAFAEITWWRPVVLTVGLTTMFIGGWRALRQHDLKLLLAHGTVSQLGLLVVLLGLGEPKATFAGVALILAHGLFKATLFMVVGAVDHGAGGRDIRKLSGLRRTMPITFSITVAALASMAALPPLFGFVAKEAAFDALTFSRPLLAFAIATASVLTVAYSARFLFEVFTGTVSPEAGAAHEPKNGLVGWPAGLAIGSVVLGLWPAIVLPLVKMGAGALSGVADGKLVLWPDIGPALGLSAVTLLVGTLIAAGRHRVEIRQARISGLTSKVPSAEEVYNRLLKGVTATADNITALVQNGSLPAYLATITLTAVFVPTGIAIFSGSLRLHALTIGTATEWTLVILVGLAAAGLTRVQRRFAAVLLLGAVGYAVAGLYLLAGGPDLALTQLLIETLLVLLFALVLVRLPSHFDEPPRSLLTRTVRATTAVSVAAFVALGGLVASSARSTTPVSDYYVEAAVPEAGGANIVNVILVDFRGFDTLGEITVLVVAGLGVAGLVIPLMARARKDRD